MGGRVAELEVVAAALDDPTAKDPAACDRLQDLVHVDLSQVVDKYLGETEKRLSRLFDAAENGGMVLLFDDMKTQDQFAAWDYERAT